MVEILYQEVIGLRAPAGIGSRSGGTRILPAIAHAIYLLDVVPLG